VAEGVRGVSHVELLLVAMQAVGAREVGRGQLFLAAMQMLGSGLIGFFAGLLVGRQQIRYQRRVEVVDELRQRLREARESFANMATPPDCRLDPFRAEEVEEVGEKFDALADYFEDTGNWLDTKTRELLDDFTDEMAFLWADVRGRVDAGEDPTAPLKAAWDWLDEADEAIREINERFDRLVGTHTPWWRRMWG
jgi:hypothetical protein